MIYFLRCERDSDSIKAGWIKIGTTTRLSVRLGQIAADVGHTPTVLAVLDGSFAEERALHGKFEWARKSGEWFYPYPELLQVIETDGRPWDGTDEVPSITIINLKGTEEFRDWLASVVEESHIPASTITRLAYEAWAKQSGYPKPPKM